MPYEIIKRLEKNHENALLELLAGNIEATRQSNKKLHEVWEVSFDWKDCRSNEFTWQKLITCTIIPVQANGYSRLIQLNISIALQGFT